MEAGTRVPCQMTSIFPCTLEVKSATAPMVRGAYIADLIATLAMLDPILGGIDR